MQEYLLKIDFRNVDLASVETEDDFHREAKRLLPGYLVQLGEAVAERTWDESQKRLKSPGVKLNTSSSDKRKFIKEAGKNYQRKASTKDRKQLEDYIVQQLRSYKEQC